MPRRFNVAVVGATGLVGTELLRILEDRNFPVDELRLFASAASVGKTLEYQGEECDVHELTESSFAGIDIAFFCAGGEQSRAFCPAAVSAGAVCIDCSGAWAEDPEVPLVVSEVNPDDIARFRTKGILAIPASSTILLVLPLKALSAVTSLRRVVVSTYQAVSGSGGSAVEELQKQAGELLNGRPVESRVFPHQIGFNCLPQVDAFLENGYTREEMRLIGEARKVLGADGPGITATAVQVPVFYGHALSVNLETAEKVTPERARALLAGFPGLEVVDDPAGCIYPTFLDVAGGDAVSVGRIRQDESVENGLNLWVAADNLRKGAAINAVQVGEQLIAHHLGRA